MQRRSIAISVAASAVIAGGLLATAGALLAQRSHASPAAATAATEPLAAAPVALRKVLEVYAADAVVEAVRQATVSAQIHGAVTELHVDAGDRVRRGQLLARIDTRETDAQVVAGRAGVTQAEAAVGQAQLNFERSQRLVQQGFVSQAALDRADADLKAARAALEAARAGTERALTARSFAEVRAPIDGVVSQRMVERGELATAGRPLLALHDPAQLRAVGAVPQFVLARVLGARSAQVELPTLAATVDAVRVTVLPAADARLLSTLVRADLGADLPAGVLPGTAAKVLLPVGSAHRRVIPAGAVLLRGELTAAYVIGADGRPQLRKIRVGERVTAVDAPAEPLVEVLAGLAEGERVALDPVAAGGRLR